MSYYEALFSQLKEVLWRSKKSQNVEAMLPMATSYPGCMVFYVPPALSFLLGSLNSGSGSLAGVVGAGAAGEDDTVVEVEVEVGGAWEEEVGLAGVSSSMEGQAGAESPLFRRSFSAFRASCLEMKQQTKQINST